MESPKVGDRALAPVTVRRPGEPAEPVASAGPGWVVIVDGGAVTGVVAPAPGPGPSAFVVVEAGTPVDAAVRSAAFQELDEGDVVVVVDGAAVLGVWHGPDLFRALVLGAARAATDTELPGQIDIPRIHRACRWPGCTARMAFAEKPATVPDCPNPDGLPPHTFGW